MPVNSRFYENNMTYGRERSFRKHRQDGMITESDEELIRMYISELSAGKGISERRANKIGFTLIHWRRFLATEYQQLDINDIYKGILELKKGNSAKGKPFKQDTLHDYVIILKPFLRWMIDNDHNCRLLEKKVLALKAPPMDYNVTLPEDLPTMDEMVEIIKYTVHPMEKAFVAVLYESAARVGEAARLTWRDLVQDELGYKIYLDDQKTSQRRYGRLTMCSEYLNTYRNLRPGASGDDFVFTMDTGKPLKYSKAFKIVQEAIQRAVEKTDNEDIRKSLAKKIVTPHDFRRARITHMIILGYPETAIKLLAWGNLNTQQFRVYVKLCELDLDRVFLEKAGIVRKKDDIQMPTAPRPCSYCHTINGCDSDFCSKCGRPLTEKKIRELADAEDDIDQDKRFKDWMEKVRLEAKEEFRKMMSTRT